MFLARLLSASPQTDGEHWDLAFRWHYDAWHTDAYGQNPAPFQRNPQLTGRSGPPYPWRPGGTSIWGGFDALFPALDGFKVTLDASNNLNIFGVPPNNTPPVGNAPQCPPQATDSATGGLVSSGSYLLAISASESGPVNNHLIRAVMPSGVTTGTFTISGVVWSAAAPAISLYAGTSSLTMHALNSISWTGSSPDTYGNPTVFTISIIDPDGTGLPDPVFNSFLFQAKQIIHGGVWGSAATSIGTSGGAATATFAGAAWTTNQWAGYVLSSYGAGSGIGGVGPLNYLVASNTANTLTFSTSHGPIVGVAVVMRAAATSITATTIGDANFVNFFNGGTGLTVNAEVGNLIRIIAGTGAGQPLATIVSNTTTVLTIAAPWAVTPDSTSLYIVEAPAWQSSVPGSTSTGAFGSVGSIPVANSQAGSLLIEAITTDINGNWSVERYAPIREIFVPALTGNGYFLIVPALDGLAPISLANGANQRMVIPETTLNGAISAGATALVVNTQIINNTATPFAFAWNDGTGETGTCTNISGLNWTINAAVDAHANAASLCTPVTFGAPTGSPAAGADLSIYVDMPAAGAVLFPAFTTGTGGFSSDFNSQDPIGTASTRSIYLCTFHGTVWGLDSFRTGASIT